MDSMVRPGGDKPPKPGTASAIRELNGNGDARRPETPTKRVYSAELKQRVVRELAALAASGEKGAQGAFLRREGLHWPTVKRWQKEAEDAQLTALEPKKRGRKPTRDVAADELARLRRQNDRLQDRLRKAEIIIDVQKKLSALLGVELPPAPDDEDEVP
jgi:transposase